MVTLISGLATAADNNILMMNEQSKWRTSDELIWLLKRELVTFICSVEHGREHSVWTRYPPVDLLQTTFQSGQSRRRQYRRSL